MMRAVSSVHFVIFDVSLLLAIALALLPVCADSSEGVSSGKGKTKLVFVINTTEHDVKGTGVSPRPIYETEFDWIRPWEKIAPDAKVVRIRANSNEEVRRQLDMWMKPNPDDKEVVGLGIYSHGEPMHISDEAGGFSVSLPNGIEAVFQPIVGRMGKGARIYIDGCLILQGQDPKEAAQSLRLISQRFGLSDGAIYASSSKANSIMEIYKTNILNPDVSHWGKAGTLAAYIAAPILLPAIAVGLSERNRGHILELRSNGDFRLFEARHDSIFEPSLQVLKEGRPLLAGEADLPAPRDHRRNDPGAGESVR